MSTLIETILIFVLGGTNLWTIISYVVERRKRKLLEKQTELDIDSSEFANIRTQMGYYEEQIEKFIEKERKRDAMDDEMREAFIEIKRKKHEIEIKVVNLEQQLRVSQNLCCNRTDCESRIKC